jgi:hypothetical protein
MLGYHRLEAKSVASNYMIVTAASAGLTLLVSTTIVIGPSFVQSNVPAIEQVSAIRQAVAVVPSAERMVMHYTSPVRADDMAVAEIQKKLKIAYAVGGVTTGLFLLFTAFAIMNVVNFAIWLPTLPALIGIMAMAGAHIERLERRRQSV